MNNILQILKGLDFRTVLIGILILVILTMNMCGGDKTKPNTIKVDGKKYELVKHKIDTIYKTKDTIVYRPGKKIYVEKPIYINIPSGIDTTAILKDYYATRVYKDTLSLGEKIGYLTLTDTITQNKIKGRIWNSSLKQEIIKETIIVKELPKTQVYLGGSIGGSMQNAINFVGPSAMLKTKKDRVYIVSAGYGIEQNLIIQGGLLWKIRFK